jgi:hypothetical protein
VKAVNNQFTQAHSTETATASPTEGTGVCHDSETIDSPRWWLSNHVFHCLTQDGVVLLDAKHNKYYGLDADASKGLSGVVQAWPSIDRQFDPQRPLDTDSVAQTLKMLERIGVVTNREPSGVRMLSFSVDRSQMMEAVGFGTEMDYAIRLSHLLIFLRAYMAALFALKFQTFDAVVRGVKERREQAALSTEGLFDAGKAVELVSIFRRIRHYVFSGSGRCLLHALTLVNFLAAYKQFPLWVIGVTTTPWTAHSWVEQGRFLLDATPERVHAYTVILAV